MAQAPEMAGDADEHATPMAQAPRADASIPQADADNGFFAEAGIPAESDMATSEDAQGTAETAAPALEAKVEAPWVIDRGPDLPPREGIDRLSLLVKDPRTVYLYWSVSSEEQPGHYLVVELWTRLGLWFQREGAELSGDAWVTVPPNTWAMARLCRVSPGGPRQPLLWSSPVQTPPQDPISSPESTRRAYKWRRVRSERETGSVDQLLDGLPSLPAATPASSAPPRTPWWERLQALTQPVTTPSDEKTAGPEHGVEGRAPVVGERPLLWPSPRFRAESLPIPTRLSDAESSPETAPREAQPAPSVSRSVAASTPSREHARLPKDGAGDLPDQWRHEPLPPSLFMPGAAVASTEAPSVQELLTLSALTGEDAPPSLDSFPPSVQVPGADFRDGGGAQFLGSSDILLARRPA